MRQYDTGDDCMAPDNRGKVMGDMDQLKRKLVILERLREAYEYEISFLDDLERKKQYSWSKKQRYCVILNINPEVISFKDLCNVNIGVLVEDALALSREELIKYYNGILKNLNDSYNDGTINDTFPYIDRPVEDEIKDFLDNVPLIFQVNHGIMYKKFYHDEKIKSNEIYPLQKEICGLKEKCDKSFWNGTWVGVLGFIAFLMLCYIGR